MRLQTKIALGIIPLVLGAIVILGLWSIKKTGENIHQSAFLYMDTIINAYLQDIARHHDLLKTDAALGFKLFVFLIIPFVIIHIKKIATCVPYVNKRHDLIFLLTSLKKGCRQDTSIGTEQPLDRKTA